MRRAMARAPWIAVLLLTVLISACQSKSDALVYDANETAKKALQSDPTTREQLLVQARGKLDEAVKLDPKNLNGWKLLSQIDEVLGNDDDAGHDFDQASMLDPTDQKLMGKARYYKQLKDLENSSNQALDQIKDGKAEEGVRQLKDILVQSRARATREKALSALKSGVVMMEGQGDQAVAAKKYADAIAVYEQEIRAYMLIAEAHNQQKLDPASDSVLHKINDTAKTAGTPDATFRVLNDVLAVDPDNKTANIELAQVYLRRKPADYDTAADLEERGGASDADVKKLRDQAKRQHRG
jgi:tetratricopeptide (TPR) repeat protein